MDTDAAILALVRSRALADQAALLEALAERGLKLSQPTLSRHLRKLGIRKRSGRYVAEEPVPQRGVRARVACSPPNLLVLRTAAGYAQALALHLDAQPLPGQAGTLAGDDTVFVALLEPRALEIAAREARRRFEGG